MIGGVHPSSFKNRFKNISFTTVVFHESLELGRENFEWKARQMITKGSGCVGSGTIRSVKHCSRALTSGFRAI
jgi:hypothetical protein